MIACVPAQSDWPAVEMVWCGFVTPILRIYSQRQLKTHSASRIHQPSVSIPKIPAK